MKLIAQIKVKYLRVPDVAIRDNAATLVNVHAGKGMKTRRAPLPTRGRDAVAGWLKEHGDSGFLFSGKGGGHIAARHAARIVERLRLAAGIGEGVSPHQLPHTFPHRLVSRGVRLERVGDLLGHYSLDTTKVYTVPTDEELAQDVARAWD